MDAVCRPCVDKRSPYGWKCRVGSERFSFDRSVYDRIYFAVFIGRHFYCTAFRSFQKAYEDTSGENASGKADKEEKDQDPEKVRAHMGELKDQFGKSHKLEDYKGKVIFLNFWATWCGPCRSEMPEIQKLYEEYTVMGNDSEVVILGVAGPGIGQEGTVSDITKFMEENGYTYPVLMDETGELFEWYGISAFPTTYMIDRDGNLYGYVTGQLTEDIMRSIIKQTLEGKAP